MVYSNEKPNTFRVELREVRIAWNIHQEPVNTLDDQQETQWVYNEAVIHPLDTREVIIRKIIASVHAIEDELALINNQDEVEYAEYQQLRSDAKRLADEYLALRVDNVDE